MALSVSAMITTCNQACKFIDYGVRFFWKVRHEAAQEDEGRSLGAGLQRQAPNHLKLHW